ncbi:Uncharacterized protein BM_BM7555 [Brugia malayi]|uniref:Bm7555 n=1 Tax=Brugia malayi TaxID=6279 RepID=A0A0K0JSV8_BRUMA|nr:Uncharacterized protein BM_BM7555 [Brugia malayi]CRZ23437.1 Bm7555 [Brugia malayi]VIO87358.1 Uncharacterized protein BM_BM7555 [Brugia malayi]
MSISSMGYVALMFTLYKFRFDSCRKRKQSDFVTLPHTAQNGSM